jgi:Fanconi anemia group M protein
MEGGDIDRSGLIRTRERVAERLVLRVDPGERGSVLFDLVERCPLFDVRVARLRAGDYGIGDEVLIERKSYRDLEVSVVDGRLFTQAARLVHEAARGLILVEGRRPDRPRVHPHAITGAILSLAVDWRFPVLFADGPNESLLVLRLIAEHRIQPSSLFVARHNYKPKRLASRRLHVLEGLPGVGPALARRTLSRFATVEQVMMADGEELVTVSRAPTQRWRLPLSKTARGLGLRVCFSLARTRLPAFASARDTSRRNASLTARESGKTAATSLSSSTTLVPS